MSDTSTSGYSSAVRECPTCEGAGRYIPDGCIDMYVCSNCSDGFVPVAAEGALWASVVLPGDTVQFVYTADAALPDWHLRGTVVAVYDGHADVEVEGQSDIFEMYPSDLTLVVSPYMRPDYPDELRWKP